MFEKLQQVKDMITQLVASWTIIISKTGLSKQQALDSDPKAIQQINITGTLEQQAKIFFIIQEAKETILDFSQGTVKVLYFYFVLI